MKVLLSPAKSMREENTIKGDIPIFIKETKTILNKMKSLSSKEIRELMSVSDKIAKINYDRFQNFFKQKSGCAAFIFDGAVYKSLNIENFNKKELKLANEQIRILSGMYGMLRPMDKIVPYRLEMGTRISIKDKKDLYDFWKKSLTEHLDSNIKKNELIVNLASVEYSKAIDLNYFGDRVINPIFKEKKGDDYKVVAVHAKRARGLMARWIIQSRASSATNLKDFNLEGYRYSSALSSDLVPVFVRG